MNNFEKWLGWLAEPEVLQCQGALAKYLDDEDTIGYCCLGYGSFKAGVRMVEIEYPAGYDVAEESALEFGEAAVTGTAPREFIEWLGRAAREQPVAPG